MKSESAITQEILSILRLIPHSSWDKNHGSPYGTRGRPDIEGCVLFSGEYDDPEQNKGRHFAFEVKTEKGELTPWQEKKLQDLKNAGAVAEIVRSVEETVRILESHGIPIASIATEHGRRLGTTSTRTKRQRLGRKDVAAVLRAAQREKPSEPLPEKPGRGSSPRTG